MTWLLDVNALIAALLDTHEHHQRLSAWIRSLPREEALATCSITELGYVRVLHQAPQYRVEVRDSVKTLARFHKQSKLRVILLSDGLGGSKLPSWVKTGRHTTDGHLLALAEAHGARLATIDTGIPGAFLIPPFP